jgi:hypothetical protein
MAALGAKVRIDFREIAALRRQLPEVVPAMKDESAIILTRVGATGVGIAKKRVRKDTGKGRRSITSLVRGQTLHLGSPLLHMRVMEKGRRPGAKLPPKGVLLGWMRRHGIPAENEYVIRRAIARHGIEGDHVFEETLRELVPIAKHELRELRVIARDALRVAGR